MGSLILDTSAVIGLLERADRNILGSVRESAERPKVSIVTLGELHHGVARSRRSGDSDSISARTRSLRAAQALDVLPITIAIAECFGDLSAVTPRTIGVNDRWIIASAVVGGRTLVTQDEELAVINGLVFEWDPPRIIFHPVEDSRRPWSPE